MGHDVVDLVGRDAGVGAWPCVMAIAAPRPVGSGAEMWKASAVSAAPMSSAWMRRAARQRVLGRLEDDDAGALAEEEAVAVAVERPRGLLGIVVALRERAHVREGREAHRQERRLRAAGDDDVDLAALDHAQAVEEAMTLERAGRDLGDDRAREAVLHRELAGGHRAREGRDGEGADEAGAPRLDRVAGPSMTCSRPPPPVLTRDGHAIALLRAPVVKSRPASATASLPAAMARWMKRLMRRAILRSMATVGSKSLTSAAMRTSRSGGVEGGDRPAAADAGHEVAPERGVVVADGRDGAEAGDDGTT